MWCKWISICANYEPIKKSQAIQLELFKPTFEYKADIYPGYDCPLIFSTGDAIEWREVKFGLVPKWAKDLKICRNTYNARTETVHEKPSFRNAWAKSQFALIPVQTIFWITLYRWWQGWALGNLPERSSTFYRCGHLRECFDQWQSSAINVYAYD